MTIATRRPRLRLLTNLNVTNALESTISFERWIELKQVAKMSGGRGRNKRKEERKGEGQPCKEQQSIGG
jgi:hypothetical protein